MSERNNERLRFPQKLFRGLQYFIWFFKYYDRLTSDLLMSGFGMEKQIYCSSEANLTGHSVLHRCRTTQFRQQNHYVAAPSVPRDPRPLLHPSSSPPPPTLLLCALTHPQQCCVARSLTRSQGPCATVTVSFCRSTKPLSHLSLDFWVILCTLTVKAPLHYPNPEAPKNMISVPALM